VVRLRFSSLPLFLTAESQRERTDHTAHRFNVVAVVPFGKKCRGGKISTLLDGKPSTTLEKGTRIAALSVRAQRRFFLAFLQFDRSPV
jgi:hypothetical protein